MDEAFHIEKASPGEPARSFKLHPAADSVGTYSADVYLVNPFEPFPSAAADHQLSRFENFGGVVGRRLLRKQDFDPLLPGRHWQCL